MIKRHALAPVAAIDGARIRELTGDDRFPKDMPIIPRTFRAAVGSRSYHVGFCLGDGEAFSAIGIAVIERLSMEVPEGPLHVVAVQHADVAWDVVLRHLRTFVGQTLLFCFPNSDVYDAGVAEICYSNHIEQFDPNGEPLGRLTDAQRRAHLHLDAGGEGLDRRAARTDELSRSDSRAVQNRAAEVLQGRRRKFRIEHAPPPATPAKPQ